MYEDLNITNSNKNNIIINLENITKKYPNSSGVFDVNIKIKKGEVFGFIGPNGAGKSTTIRQIVGFIKPDNGNVSVLGLNPWTDSEKIMDKLGYTPGEPIIPNNMKGIEFLRLCFKIRKLKDWKKVEELIDYFSFDPNKKIKKMSKGMKQKIMIIAAIMHDPEVLILDEPTSGLDPIMQAKFNEIIKKLNNNGTTILMSSHIFSEIQNACTRFAMIKNGKIVSMHNIEDLKNSNDKTYEILFKNKNELNKFKELKFNIKSEKENSITVSLEKSKITNLLKTLGSIEVENFSEVTYGIESEFRKLYGDQINAK